MFKVKLFIFSLCIYSISFAQSNTESFWTALLDNDRKEASSILKKEKNQKTLEYKMTKAILNTENGRLTSDTKLLSSISNDSEAENYIYAFWTEPYVFGSYIESGFDKGKLENVKYLRRQNLKNPIYKNALYYISGISERYKNNWDKYHAEMNKIESIKKWQFCGPFENLNSSGIDHKYPPEYSSTSEDGYDANSNGLLNWYIPKTDNEPYLFFSNHNEYGYGVNYAQTFITSNENKRVQIRIGSSSKTKLWLNNILIFENNNDVNTDIDAFTIEATIPEGSNRLLIKNAEGNGVSYFSVRITDTSGNKVEGLEIYQHEKEYIQSDFNDINPKPISHSIESYFIQKSKESKNNFLYDYALVSTYLRNGKYQEAHKIIEPWYKKHPKSSLIKKILILIYNKEQNYTSINDIKENLDVIDPDYYFNLIYKSTETDKIQRMSLEELKTFRKRLADNIDYDLLLFALDFNIIAKKMDEKGLKTNLDKIIKYSEDDKRMYSLSRLAMFYSSIFKNDKKTKDILERNKKEWFYYPILENLNNIYNRQGDTKEALKIYLDLVDKLPGDNTILIKLAKLLYSKSKYKEALIYVDKGLINYPYSFVIIELKADILVQLGKKEEALILYKKALRHNSANNSLRKKINNLSDSKNNLTDYKEPNIYNYIKLNRGKETVNNYGYSILLDEVITEIQTEGGNKNEVSVIYKITSQSGIDIFKEYNLGLSGRYNILKTEVIKNDGSISPADKSGSSLVFKNLEKGDVIYLNYEQTYSGSGRFYKDFVDYNSFDSYHPSLKTIYKLLVPKGINIKYEVVNGEIELKKTENKDWTVYDWTLNNVKNKDMYEDYMPLETDIFRYLHISTIESWNDIANWYSDLVSSQIVHHPDVDKTFNIIFENGIEGISDNDKSEMIYNYIVNNINYSSVNFRQSGFIPQKPSKTLKTKLGDCKDLSTLFVILAQKANIKANLVLVLTSDNGIKSLRLPSQHFNHCIVKTMIDGQEQYLELTDKDLPYKALPTTLVNSLILNIPLEKNENQTETLQNLTNPKRCQNNYKNIVHINIDKDFQKLKVKTTSEGTSNSFYTEIFNEPNKEVQKNRITQEIKDRMGSNLTVDSLYDVKNILNNPIVSFTTNITTEEKINKIGSTYIYKLPIISRIVTGFIINKNERKYPINYIQYENSDYYETTYFLNIEKDEVFTEIPKDLDISYKDHTYKMTFNKLNDHSLKVDIIANTDLSVIETSDYLGFKKYVKQILEAEESLIGFKKK